MAARAAVTFAPASGQPGNLITITGSGFTAAATTNVFFNHLTLADFDIVSSTQLRVVVPPGAQSGVLSVNAANNSAATFYVAPRIDSFTPETGVSPLQISITGANFISGGTNTLVTFPGTNGSLTVTGTVVSVTQVSAKVPAGATNGPIIVTTLAGSAVSTDSFIASNHPLITDFSPTAGTNGASVLINGANFINGTIIKFGATAATSITIVSLTQISAKVPAGAATGGITVSNVNGTFTTSSNFVTGPKPIVTGFSPAYGKAGDAVTINGFNFSTATGVSFNGHGAGVSSVSATSLQAFVPVGATTGVITVTNPSGSGSSTAAFLTGSGPVVTGFSPIYGGPGTAVLISGFNFTGLAAGGVKFNNTTASATATADNQIQATVPAGAAIGPIKVTVGGGTFITGSNFNVTGGAPIVTNCSPASGVRGALITITGANFTNTVSAVKFNGSAAIFLTPTDPGTLKAYVPTNATSGPVSVTTGSGTGTSSFLFYVQPRVTDFTPANGIVNATFAINGRNLTNATSVQVNGVDYPFSNAATQLVATVPPNATTGPLVVTTPAGSIIATNNFIVLPKIYGFTPMIGPTGAVVAVSGTSLFNVSAVKFGGGASAAPFNVGTNQLQVIVPAGAATGPLQITTPYGTDTSSNSFTFTTGSKLVLTKTVAPAIAIVGQPVIYTLTLTNEGPSVNTGVKITDNLPGAFAFISATSTVGTCAFTNGVVTCDIGVMNTNTSVTLVVNGTALQAGAWTNTAQASSVEDPGPFLDYRFAFAYDYVIDNTQRALTIAKLAGQPKAVVSWPSSAVNFVLQFNTNLNNSTNWQVPFPGPNTNGPVNYFTNDLALPQTFFRLKSP